MRWACISSRSSCPTEAPARTQGCWPVSPWRALSAHILGYSVLATEEQATTTTLEKTRQVLQLLDPSTTLADDSIRVDGSQRGDAYGAPTDAMLEAVRLLASREGLLTDPVYGGKAFSGLLAAVRRGDYPAGSNLLFVMTGGMPGLFAYRSAFD